MAYLEEVRDADDAPEYVRVAAAREFLLRCPAGSPVELTGVQAKELFMPQLQRIVDERDDSGKEA